MHNLIISDQFQLLEHNHVVNEEAAQDKKHVQLWSYHFAPMGWLAENILMLQIQ